MSYHQLCMLFDRMLYHDDDWSEIDQLRFDMVQALVYPFISFSDYEFEDGWDE